MATFFLGFLFFSCCVFDAIATAFFLRFTSRQFAKDLSRSVGLVSKEVKTQQGDG